MLLLNGLLTCAVIQWRALPSKPHSGTFLLRRTAYRWRELIGATRQRVSVGVSVGIEPTLAAQLERIAQFVEAGYARIKLKDQTGMGCCCRAHSP